jgi:hypothetical protein
MGFEPTTPTLARLCSTPELHPHPRVIKTAIGTVGYCRCRMQAMPKSANLCNRALCNRALPALSNGLKRNDFD